MTKRNSGKLNWLEKNLPDGLLVDAAWLTRHGFSTSLRSQYLAAGWLQQPTRGVYCRMHGDLSWQQVVISLQNLLELPVVVGGRTAIEAQGFAHYLSQKVSEVHLYGTRPLPGWVNQLPLATRFVYHSSKKLFANDPITLGLTSLSQNLQTGEATSADPIHGEFNVTHWGQWDWPLTLSTPERAILELLDEIPNRETFEQADKIMEGLTSLSPRRLQKLLEECRSIKVKRLFFFLADRHQHQWLRRIERELIYLGKGKRMLVKGGKLDPVYQITVPRDLHAV